MKQLKFDYIHCDVFTNQQMKGNSLTVFFLENSPDQYGRDILLSITREMKHFESIFVRVEKDLKCDNHMPLSGLNVLDLTRVIAGPICTRTMSELGANVMRVGSPNLPEIYQLILDTARGKLSANLDFNDEKDLSKMYELITNTDIICNAYRPHGLDKFGITPQNLSKIKPSIIYVSLTAYSHLGPWANRHGYDSLVQAATGIAYTNGLGLPKHLPCQTLDYVAGFINCFGAMEALRRRATEGGSYIVRTSLVQVANWLINLGFCDNYQQLATPRIEDLEEHFNYIDSDYERVRHIKPLLKLSETPLLQNLPLVKIGSSIPKWK